MRTILSLDLTQIFLVFFVYFALLHNLQSSSALSLLHYSLHQLFVLLPQLCLLSLLLLRVEGRQSFLLACERTFSAVNFQHLFDESPVLNGARVEDMFDEGVALLEFV